MKVRAKDTPQEQVFTVELQNSGPDKVRVNGPDDYVLATIGPDGIRRIENVPTYLGLPVDKRGRVLLLGERPDPAVEELAEYLAAREKVSLDESDACHVSFKAGGKSLTVGLLRRIVQAAGLVLLLCATAAADSPESYYLWVTQQNQAAMRAAYARHDAVKARVGDRTVRGTRSTESAIVKHRFGGGVGAGGFGGEGGYSGYSNSSVGGVFGFNYGYGFGQPGNHSETAESGSTSTYEKVWHDDAWYGGPVEVLNPFCPPN